MSQLTISAITIEKHYAAIHQIGVTSSRREEGYTRTPYSLEETLAIDYLSKTAKDAGLITRCDKVGNLIIETPGDYEEYVETGSHLDTVPFGGNYDGMAGIIAGLEVLIAFHRSNKAFKKGLRLRGWRGEESASFGHASIGSKAAFGCLDPVALQATYKERTLECWMNERGVDSSSITKNIPALSKAEITSISAYLELHIEQGNVLEVQKKDIGIVTGVRGSARYVVRLTGEFDHSGATPMGISYRKDVNLALGHIIVALDNLAENYLQKGMDLVQTIGIINSNHDRNNKEKEIYKNAISKVSGFCYFSFEVRSCGNRMKEYCHIARQLIETKSKELGIKCHIEELSYSQGINSLHTRIQQVVVGACNKTGSSFLQLVSGAWHDAAVVAEQKKSDGMTIPSGLIFIPCRDGKSHSPDEYVSYEQIATGATVLGQAMLELAEN